MMQHIFSIYHPAVIFLYFCGAIIFCMCTLHPVYIMLSFIIGSIYFVMLKGLHAYRKALKYYLAIICFVAVINPLFNSLGLTLLFYLGDTPITVEAVCYGLCSGGMLASVLIWFSCYSVLMTSDKFMQLFSRVAPTMAMVLSMIFRYVPDTIKKAREITVAQSALLGTSQKTRAQGIRIASILMSWSMENAIETADSMRARGYGRGPHTSFTNERFSAHDILSLSLLAALIIGNAIFLFQYHFSFYPRLSQLQTDILPYLLYAVMLSYPIILEGKERLAWMRLH